jgi:hypothetical protein
MLVQEKGSKYNKTKHVGGKILIDGELRNISNKKYQYINTLTLF